MPTLLTRLKINEVSSVDRGAGKNVKIFLTKRDETIRKAWGPDFLDMTTAWSAEDAELLAYCKREFSDKERQHLAQTGEAMSGGGYPIKSERDLRNAIRAIGRAKNPSAARAHIKERARALGSSDLIPETWGKAMSAVCKECGGMEGVHKASCSQYSKTLDFAKAMAAPQFIAKVMVEASARSVALNKTVSAGKALKAACASISDLDEDERDEAFTKSLDQCVDYLASQMPEASRDGFRAAVAAISVAKGPIMPKTMTLEELTESIAKLSERNAYLENIAKLSAKERQHMDDNDMDDDQRKAFAAKSPEDRAKLVGKTDDEGEGDNSEQQRRATPEGKPTKGGKPTGGKGVKGGSDIDKIDDPIVKSVLAELGGENVELKKKLEALERDKEVAICKALCRDNGLPESDAQMIMDLRKSNPAGAEAFLKRTKALMAQANPKLFVELGKGGDGGTEDPVAAIWQKAQELQNEVNKSASKPSEHISIEKARMLARERNPALAKAERELEQRRRLGRAA